MVEMSILATPIELSCPVIVAFIHSNNTTFDESAFFSNAKMFPFPEIHVGSMPPDSTEAVCPEH
jgi:hypothetical protein